MCAVELPVPDIEKQRKIVKAYKTITDRIALKQRINDNLEATAQAIFQERFASFYSYDDLPAGYSIVNLDSLCTIKGGKRLPTDCELLDTPTEHPYIRVRDVGNSRYICLTNQFQYIDEYTHSAISRYTVDTNDIVISIVGTIGLLGKVHHSLDKANLTENCVKLTDVHTITPDYLYYTLCYKKQIKEIELLTVGAVQAKLPMYNIQSMKILVPPAGIMDKFQMDMEVFNTQIEANTIEIQRLYDLQNLLLAKLSD
jgi:type I restriction enzyme S subunit